jgi:prepilin-type N-terminal cleavage/methylation domain-containing protein
MKGFTLIELMIVVAIIAIIAAIAIPSLLQSKMAANEASAISALRTLSSAQELYRTRLNTYGDLATLGTRGYIDAALADADTDAKSGYLIDIQLEAVSKLDWCAVAVPATTRDGERYFCIDTSGVIYWKDCAGVAKTLAAALGETYTQVLGSQ